MFDKLEIGLTHSAYLTVLSRSINNINEGGSLISLKATILGKSVWENIIQDSDNFIENLKFSGVMDIMIKRQAVLHRKGYTPITESADHVNCQIPNGSNYLYQTY